MKKWMSRCLPLVIVVLIAVMGYYGGWWTGIFSKKQTVPVKPQPAAPEFLITQSKLAGWDNHRKTWEVEAEKIWQTANGGTIYFEKISHGVIFSVKGERVTFQAKWARWEKIFNQLTIGGGLSAEVDGKKLQTDQLLMQYNSDTLFSPGEIVVRGKNLLMKAGAMSLTLKDEILNLNKGVEFSQNGNNLRSEGVRFDLKNEQFDLIEPEGVTLNL
jgi:LPS export ABC transporter protein LptC